LAHGGEVSLQTREQILMQRQINALLLSDRLLAQQMAELSTRVGKVESVQQSTTDQVVLMRRELAEIKQVTTQVRDLMTAGRVVRQVGNGIGWIAKTGAALALLWAAVMAVLHVKPPQG
jgi:hypothetical protein